LYATVEVPEAPQVDPVNGFVGVDLGIVNLATSSDGQRAVDKRNRRSQAEFECGRCGFVGHADHNAAINIATRGVERWGEVMRPHAAPTLTAR
jgi:putative transposase